ncbi:GNAT family N-acetyltransferase [Candidatus Thiosymbion oneisti]|uniref:GNAT family N-acetyltransferase n=1 Tax=Candidatus Thiosymbion oneisti TaxID=589554 RepID=UPI000B7F526B|nr:GNAT family N-acetyltransferase [Candidatus Thiosymbion oneisti]
MNNQSIVVVEAVASDRAWVSDTMQSALENYYGGDHRAHARRIFDAHLDGGTDRVGFFSHEQKMFIAKEGDKRLGMIHIVGKKQNTYKVSPLIVDPNNRGRRGVGSILLQFAESYARNNQARQIYCTVAEQNIAAMQFFVRKGFIQAGNSLSHYKMGITEHMFYKPLMDKAEVTQLDDQHISVLPLSDVDVDLRPSIREILLNSLPLDFEGIDDKWVDSLFSGYDRRHEQDVNSKYKLIYAAMNSRKEIVGVAGATPKKGSPIKVMPFISTTDAAFEALLIDIPHQLAEYGHKLYIHINPSPVQVILLQRLNWRINALMPSAYRPDIVTQQWSYDVNEQTIRTLRIKDKFFKAIETGEKDLEVRVGYETIRKIAIGERIELHAHTNKLEVKVADIRIYQSFGEMLSVEPFRRIVPDTKSVIEARGLLENFYPPEKERLGVYVLSFSLSKSSRGTKQ